MFTTKLFVFTLTFLLAFSQNCPTSYLEDDLQTGTKTIVNFGQGSFSATSIIFLRSTRNPQFAATLSSIDSYRPDLDGGFQFSVSPKSGNIRGRFASFEVKISGGNSWKQAQIKYMISKRQDFAIGNFKADYSRTNTNFMATYDITNQLPDKQYNVITFLSGIQHSSNKFDFQIKSSTFSDNIVTINFVANQFESLKSIEFMYIIYPAAHTILNFVYTYPSQSQLGSYQISGLVKIQGQNQITQGQWKVVNRFLECQGSGCTKQCVRFEQCQGLTGIINGNKCILCQKNNQGQCIEEIDNQPVLDCPERSTLNLITYKCQCDFGDQYLIDGQCLSCKQNQIFNGTQCICSLNYYLINGQCKQCDPRSTYNPQRQDCFCNLGFYGDRDLCQPCHQSCSQCSGPQSSQCTKCADITLTLKDGFCTKSDVCNPGQYLDSSGTCQSCSEYCAECQSLDLCERCAVGFILKQQTFDGFTFSFCEQICGDGRRFNSQCDDGNNDDGDCCSSTCQVEDGCLCIQGTSQTQSQCRIKQSNQLVILQSRGLVNLGNYVLHSIRADYLPDCVIENQCIDCFKVLDVKVVESIVPITVLVNYVPTSKYQFNVQYLFNGLYVSSAFKVRFRLNPEFSCLSQQDIQKVYTVEVDPSTLKCAEIEQQLTSLEFTAPQNVDQKCLKQSSFLIQEESN